MTPYRNQKLFSNHYLERLLPEEKEFEINEAELKEVYQKIRALWDKDRFSSLNESQLRKHFLDKVFEILGWTVDVEPPTLIGDGIKHPDYALFYSKNDLKVVQKTPKEKYFKHVACLAEAKRWERNLDKKNKSDPEDIQNPSLQMSHYLWLTEVKWGILTNGRYWRLYERETSKKIDIFYEIDLESLLENGKLENFRYFYLFFRKDAFPAFVEKVYQGSKDYAEAVGEELKENVYESLRLLAHGFLEFPNNSLSQNDLKEIHDNSLIFLYRLLFILYAEYNQLLPLGENQIYTDSYSLDAIKKEIADKLDNKRPIATSTHGYWNRLKDLFEIINKGMDELGVPPYNGGLFDPEKHPFLEKYNVGDCHIAHVIDLLSRSKDKGFIDYSSLDIRHLGSIYEGLLEYKLRIAKEDLVPIKQKGREIYVSLKEAKKQGKKIDKNKVVYTGEVYLVTDKGERKATGSYYTPRYIVKYIIESTLGPLIDNIFKKAKLAKTIKEGTKPLERIFEELLKDKEEKQSLKRLWELTKSDKEKKIFLLNLLDGVQPKHGYDLIEMIFDLKVLDPAMGSGHFLVEATDFLAKALIKALGASPKEVGDDEMRWARREVVERCIFGVDLNPLAVELAKLALWLYTVAKGRPLSFLDHHLRCGNSLIGAKINELATLPDLKKKKTKKGRYIQPEIFECVFYEKVNILLKAFELIETQPSDTVEQIREKEKLYRDFCRIVSRFQDIADVWTSIYFGNKVSLADYQELLNNLRAPDQEWEAFKAKSWFKKAKEITGQKQFFHWELEFPEVFYDEFGRIRQNPGFDAVVGNPPYDVISEKEQQKEVKEDKIFFSSLSFYKPAIGSKLNFYRLFATLSLELLKKNGRHGFIVPLALLADKQAKPLRKFLLTKTHIEKIEAFPQKDDPFNRVFFEAKLSTCVYIVEKSTPTLFFIRVHPGKDILEGIIPLEIYPDQIEEFDSDNLSIPCYPGMTTKDFHLALKLIKVCKGNVLKNLAPSQQGEVNLTSHAEFLSYNPDGQIVLRGAHIDRYQFNEEPKQGTPVYLNIEKFLQAHSKNTKAYDYQYTRIGYQRGAAIDNWRRIIATIIEKGNFCSDTVNYIVNPKQLNLFAILAFLNSSLWEWRFRLTSTNNHVNAYEINGMPIPCISFVTPENERKRLLKKFKKMYYDFLKEGN